MFGDVFDATCPYSLFFLKKMNFQIAKTMKLCVLTFCLLIFSVDHAFSQIDEMNSKPVPPELKNIFKADDDSKPLLDLPKQSVSLTDPKHRNGLQVPSFLVEKEEKKENIMSTKTDLLERTIEYKPTYLEQFRDSGGKGNQKTQYLGEFSATGKFVEIYCRDHEYVDGDRVQISINGKIVALSQELRGSFQPVLVTLEKGENRIEFKALNEGTSSPNTAEFIVYDELGNVITHNQWNLATGVKASILIHKP